MPQCITDFKDKSWMFIFIFFIEQEQSIRHVLGNYMYLYLCKRIKLRSVLYIYIYIYIIHIYMDIVSSVQSFSHELLATPWTAACQASPCTSPTPGVHPNPCPLSQWCHPTISTSIIPFSSRLQSFPASGSFQMSQLSASGGQSIGVSASTSVLPMNTQDWSPLRWIGWLS